MDIVSGRLGGAIVVLFAFILIGLTQFGDYYYLICAIAYTFISMLSCFFAIKSSQRCMTYLLISYSVVNLIAAIFNVIMFYDWGYAALRDIYWYSSINICLIVETVEIMILIVSGYYVFKCCVDYKSTNDISKYHSYNFNYFKNKKEQGKARC